MFNGASIPARNSRTLVSARNLLDALAADPTFSGWLREDARLSADFFAAKKSFDRHRPAMEHVRNTIGAHAEQDLGGATSAFAPGDEAKFEIHENDFIRAHLGTEILLAALMGDVPAEKRLAAYRAAVKPLADATGANDHSVEPRRGRLHGAARALARVINKSAPRDAPLGAKWRGANRPRACGVVTAAAPE